MHGNKVINSSAPKNGCHLEEGLVVLHGFSEVKTPIQAGIKDIFPTIMKALGVEEKIPGSIDGKGIQ